MKINIQYTLPSRVYLWQRLFNYKCNVRVWRIVFFGT